MPTCSFCKKNYDNPRGLTVFTFDGKSVFYCSSKCRNNTKLGRDPKKTNWVKRERKLKSDSDKSTKGTIGKSGDEKSGVSAKKDEKSKDVADNKKVKKEGKVEKKIEDKKEEKKAEVKKAKEDAKKEMIDEEAE